ncbi:subtilisin-like protease SBT1.4 [Andrographis paniculata]|uniref:subtilisin-like protease SBT1.4 n=1 Tax=Andrographis paniculata TaxID=175694 RepID=UPI0021E960B1|nr:subtilisin-like protease SBT1.4 [Andrographis paniculata]
MVGEIGGDKILAYVRATPNPIATIRSRETVVSKSPSSPRVVSFSSRGPRYRTSEILKPDVNAPGVNILASWTGYVWPTSLNSSNREVEFNIISGSIDDHAYNVDNNGNNLTDLATGDVSNPSSGHIDPNRATDPGLIYDIDTQNYVAFLCSIGYNVRQITAFTKDSSIVDCNAVGLKTLGDLNYPSLSVAFSGFKSVVKYKRSVRNVGKEANAVYEVTVHAPDNVEVTVTQVDLQPIAT